MSPRDLDLFLLGAAVGALGVVASAERGEPLGDTERHMRAVIASVSKSIGRRSVADALNASNLVAMVDELRRIA